MEGLVRPGLLQARTSRRPSKSPPNFRHLDVATKEALRAMPGSKKGRQRGSTGSKAQSARKWNDTIREANEDLASGRRRARAARGGDSAPPRLSAQGFCSVATLLRQRVRADEVAAEVPRSVYGPVREPGLATPAAAISYFSPESIDSRPRKALSLLSLCIGQIGRDFLAYHSEDDAIAQAFLLLPTLCLSRLSRAAAARGTVADHNIELLCSPGVSSLWLRGSFTDQGASALLPVLRTADTPKAGPQASRDLVDLAEVYRDGGAERTPGVKEGKTGERGAGCSAPETGKAVREASRDAVGQDVGGEDDWETAGDRMEGCLRGGFSLTSLDVSSPLVTAAFVERLVRTIPSLRRLGLRGSLGENGGPEAVCDQVPRLAALRELDVSQCSWFCDISLRRFAKTLSRGFPSAETDNVDRDEPASRGVIVAAEQFDEGTSWGTAPAAANTLAHRGHTPMGSLAEELVLVATGWGSGGGGGSRASGSREYLRFRTFTVTCAKTAVTEKGARVAEALSPGLMVVLEDQPTARGVLHVMR